LGDQIKPDRNLDCIGLYCPEPVFRTRQEIDKLDVGDVLEIIADDPASEEDIPRLVKRLEQKLLKCTKKKTSFILSLKK